MARRIGLPKKNKKFGKDAFYFLLLIFHFILFYTDYRFFSYCITFDCQPQIPPEEATEGRNVRPGLYPKIFMHETMLRILFFFSVFIHLY